MQILAMTPLLTIGVFAIGGIGFAIGIVFWLIVLNGWDCVFYLSNGDREMAKLLCIDIIAYTLFAIHLVFCFSIYVALWIDIFDVSLAMAFLILVSGATLGAIYTHRNRW